MSKVSQARAAENRARVVEAASSLFRRKGVDGVGIRELMGEVGLTQGGFAGQFGSKDVLAGEACAHAFGVSERRLMAAEQGNPSQRLRRMAEFYLAPKAPGTGCPMATLAGDAARAPIDGPMRRAFTNGLRGLADVIAGQEQPNDKGLALMAALVGAVVLRNATEDDALAQRIAAAVLRLSEEP